MEKKSTGLSFPTGSRKNNFIIGRQFLRTGFDSPGPRYLPHVHQNTSGALFADPNPNPGGRRSNRFSSRMYHGKGLGEPIGVNSPGPGEYSPETFKTEARGISIASKEPDVQRPILAVPRKALFINREITTKQNFGVFSPGPMYKPKSCFDPPEVLMSMSRTFFRCVSKSAVQIPPQAKSLPRRTSEDEEEEEMGSLVDASHRTSKYKRNPSCRINPPHATAQSAKQKAMIIINSTRAKPKVETIHKMLHKGPSFPTAGRTIATPFSNVMSISPGPGAHQIPSSFNKQHLGAIHIGPLGDVRLSS